jgi:hypothetical protein
MGVGKTSQVKGMAASMGWDIEILRPAERGEGALGVVPVPSEDRSVLHYPLPDWAQRLLASNKPALIFLDEVSSTPPALQPAIMGLALDGVIAGQRLPERILRCAAANPVDQAAGGWELALPLANRFIHLDWKCPSVGQWTDWLSGTHHAASRVLLDPDRNKQLYEKLSASGHLVDPEGPPENIFTWDAWEREWGQAKALGAAFLRRFPSALSEDTAKAIGRTPPAYAKPRTWEAALRLLASCRALKRMDLYPALAQGSVGPTVALEGANGDPNGAFLVWLKECDLPDPEELLDNPEKFHHDPKRPDRSFATLYAVAEAGLGGFAGKKTTEKARVERWQKAWSVLERALSLKIGKDMVLLPAKQLANRQRRPKGSPGPGGQKVCEVLGQFNDLYITE